MKNNSYFWTKVKKFSCISMATFFTFSCVFSTNSISYHIIAKADTVHENVIESISDGTTEPILADSDFVNAAFDSGFRAPSVNEDSTDIVPYSDLLAKSSSLPQNYSSVDKGYVTDIKYQGQLGICWSYAAVACMESYALSHGLVASKDDIDLSEHALASICYNDESFYDKLGGTTGDITQFATNSSGQKYTIQDAFMNGGNDQIAFKALSKWAAIANEDKAPNVTYKSDVYQYNYDASDISYILTGQKYISMRDTDNIKSAIMENGAVSCLYNSSSLYSHYFLTYHYSYDTTGVDHAIAIVGWDDTISKSKFASKDSSGNIISQPDGDGAWLIKNSWGTYYGNEGYMWLSYYDSSIQDMNACIYEIAPADKYTNNFQYDGSSVFNNSYCTYMLSNKYANVFTNTTSSKQKIEAVSFALKDVNKQYSIQIYKNPTEDAPETGTPMLTNPLTGKTSYSGYYTVALPEIIVLDENDTFAVVITFPDKTYITQSTSFSYVGACSEAVNKIADNQSYYNDSYYGMVDTYTEGFRNIAVNFCIKAFTNPYNENEISTPDITSITQKNNSTVLINWKSIDANATYTLFRSNSLNGDFSEIYSGTDTSFEDTNVSIGNTYYYKVQAATKNATSKPSSVKSISCAIIPTTINGYSSTSSEITLDFDKVDSIDGYKVYRSDDGGSNYKLIATIEPENNTFVDSDKSLKLEYDYYYYIKTFVKSSDGDIESKASNLIIAKTKLDSVNFTTDSSFYNKIRLTWDKCNFAEGYTIFTVNNGVVTDICDIESDIFTYTFDTSSYAPDSTVNIGVTSFITVNGTKVYSKRSYHQCTTRFSPVIISSAVLNANNTITVSCEPYDNSNFANCIYVVSISEDNGKNYYTISSSYKTTFNLPYYYFANNQTVNIDSSKSYLIRVYANSNSYFKKSYTALQEEGFEVYNPALQIKNIKDCNITALNDSIYTGAAITPDLTITYNNTALVNGIDYNLSYDNNINVGKATVTVTGIGKYTGSQTLYFNILPVNASNFKVDKIPAVTYSGKEYTPTPNVYYNSKLLTKDVDYALEYKNNINIGTATVTIQGINNYTGTLNVDFSINAAAPLIIHGEGNDENIDFTDDYFDLSDIESNNNISSNNSAINTNNTSNNNNSTINTNNTSNNNNSAINTNNTSNNNNSTINTNNTSSNNNSTININNTSVTESTSIVKDLTNIPKVSYDYDNSLRNTNTAANDTIINNAAIANNNNSAADDINNNTPNSSNSAADDINNNDVAINSNTEQYIASNISDTPINNQADLIVYSNMDSSDNSNTNYLLLSLLCILAIAVTSGIILFIKRTKQ